MLTDSVISCGVFGQRPRQPGVIHLPLFTSHADLGLDYTLLQNGAVSLFFRQAVLEDAILWLREHDYLVVAVDTSACATTTALRVAVVSGVPDWPPGTDMAVSGADAFSDTLMDIEFGGHEGIAFSFLHFDDFAGRHSLDAFHLLDSIESRARWHLLFGHRLMALVQSDDPLFSTQPLGARPAMWNRREWLNSNRLP